MTELVFRQEMQARLGYPLPAYLSIIINVYVTYRELIAMQCKL